MTYLGDFESFFSDLLVLSSFPLSQHQPWHEIGVTEGPAWKTLGQLSEKVSMLE